MTNLPNISNGASGTDDTPLPLIVAKQWDFPLAYIVTDAGTYYVIQDWMCGLTGETDTRYLWGKFKRSEAVWQMLTSIQRLPYKANDGRTYQRDFTTDRGLYLIAQYLRVRHDLPMLDEIRRFLAAAGAFVDAVRLDPGKLVESANNPDKLLDAFIDYHRKRGVTAQPMATQREF